MNQDTAVVVDPDAPGRLVLQTVSPPSPAPSEAVVRVAAVPLNRGEVRMALTTPRKLAARLGSGGDRGAGGHAAGRGSDRILRADEGQGHVALITGATGGVGDYACQLARLSGARVAAAIRKPEQETFVREAGADEVAVGEDLSAAERFGPYDLTLDSVDGGALATALTLLAEGGACVSQGTSAGSEITFDASRFYLTGRASLYGFILFDELKVEPASVGLARLARLVAAGKVSPRIRVEAPWIQVDDVAHQLMDRRYLGKAVLHSGEAA